MTKHTSSKLQEENRTLKKSNRILKKKVVLHEREIARFSKSLKQKGKELEQRDKDLNLERSLWNSRKTDLDSGVYINLHRIEVFDDVISDESDLHSATLCNTMKFQYILGHVKAYVTASGKMPLFCKDESRASDPGKQVQAAPQTHPADGPHPQKRQPYTGHTASTLLCRSEQRVQVPSGHEPDTGRGAAHGQKDLRRYS